MSFETSSTHDLGLSARNAGEYLGYAIWKHNSERAKHWTNVIVEIQAELARREAVGIGRVLEKHGPYDNFDAGREYTGNYVRGGKYRSQ